MILLTFALLSFSSKLPQGVALYAQRGIGENSEDTASVFSVAQEMPSYQEDISTYLAKNFKYPGSESFRNVQGSVVVQFIVEKDGTLSDIHIIRSLCPEFDKEVLRIIKIMSKWNPGKNDGRLVRVKYILPMTFKISDSN